jgi:hypothetical protein
MWVLVVMRDLDSSSMIHIAIETQRAGWRHRRVTSAVHDDNDNSWLSRVPMTDLPDNAP